MLTIFALPKPFNGHIEVIQRNALGSWLRLDPNCQIILFGDEEGTEDVAKEFNVEHVSQVAKNEFGTPIVSDLFEKARRLAKHNIMSYVNSDIILLNDFIKAIEIVRKNSIKFLMVGQVWNLGVREQLLFDQSGWESHLRNFLKHEGEIREIWATDYFAFSRELYTDMPPFALGRAFFDNWLIWKARNLRATVVDATHFVTAIHQRHDYSHVSGGKDWAHHGDEAMDNIRLAGGLSHRYSILDTTHFLSRSGLKRNLRKRFSWERLKLLKWRFRYYFLDMTRPIRHLFGFNIQNIQKIKFPLFRKKKIIEE